MPVPGQEWRERRITQIEVVKNIYPQSLYWGDTFFNGGSRNFNTDDIEWDAVWEGAPLAQYVGPELSVEPTERPTFITQGLTTPRVQYKKSISGKDLINRQPGDKPPYDEGITDPLQVRAQLQAADRIEAAKAIQNLVEIQKSQLMIGDPIPIIGIGENRYIDYGFKNKEALIGGDAFGRSGVRIIEVMRRIVYHMGELGHSITDVIMSPEVWDAIILDAEMLKLLDNRRYEFGMFNPGPTPAFGAATPVGMLAEPRVTMWYHNWTWPDRLNVRHRYLPAGYMLFISPDAKRNKMGYGAKLGKDPQTRQWRWFKGEYFDWTDDTMIDPPRDIYTMESRPIAIPGNIESWYVLKALDI